MAREPEARYATAEQMGDDAAFAIVDGAGVDTAVLLQEVLVQFGYDLHLDSLGMLVTLLLVGRLLESRGRLGRFGGLFAGGLLAGLFLMLAFLARSFFGDRWFAPGACDSGFG